ncbi:hypothetical protein ACJJTC_009797 [Scirpophaga incertulas]
MKTQTNLLLTPKLSLLNNVINTSISENFTELENHDEMWNQVREQINNLKEQSQRMYGQARTILATQLRCCGPLAVPRELVIADGLRSPPRIFGFLAGFAVKPQPRRRALKHLLLSSRAASPPSHLRGLELHSRYRADKTT